MLKELGLSRMQKNPSSAIANRARGGRAARYWVILTTTLAADVQHDIAGYALCANREDHIGRSTLARNEIHRRSASSGCTPLGAKANHREPQQQPRLYDEAPNVSFPVVANRRSSAVNRPARSRSCLVGGEA